VAKKNSTGELRSSHLGDKSFNTGRPQALDNTYNGPIDSSWCPLFIEAGTQRIELDLNTYDFSRPLFVRLRLPEDFASPLQPYTDYDVDPARTFRFANSVNSGDCLNDCSQIHLRYRAVDNLSQDTIYRGSCTFFVSVDRPLLQNTFFEFGAAEITFAEDAACFVLESGSGISVRPDKHLQYGQNGQGLLAAKQESKTTIAAGATFTFNNTLRLLHPVSFPEGGMHIYLAEGSTLRFGDMANVERKFAEANVWVYVHGKEENVDFGPLTPEERALFVFVDAPVYSSPVPLVEIHTYPNPAPAGSTLVLQFPRLESEGDKAYALYSTQGKVVAKGMLSVASNSNAEVGLPAHLVEGVYFLRATGDSINYSVSVVVRSIQ
jgi:hypothetical protein